MSNFPLFLVTGLDYLSFSVLLCVFFIFSVVDPSLPFTPARSIELGTPPPILSPLSPLPWERDCQQVEYFRPAAGSLAAHSALRSSLTRECVRITCKLPVTRGNLPVISSRRAAPRSAA